MIGCRHLTKRFGSLIAVDDVSFEMPGGMCALLGPNGAGKSTLLKMLTGLLEPDRGEARAAGFAIGGTGLEWKRAIGVVPEDLGLFDSLTVEEHLKLCGAVYGLGKPDIAERMDGLLRMLRFQEARYTFLGHCSHGTRKKTALAMALVHNPRAVFLDEPFEGIDPVATETIQRILTAISLRGVSVFFTSHQLEIVERLRPRVLMIRAGRLVWDSLQERAPRGLSELYFELVEAPVVEDLPWLRSSPS